MAGGRVVVVGLGPGDPDLVGPGLAAAVARVGEGARFVRTARHPSAGAVPGAVSFDSVYDEGGSLDEVYAGIVERLVEAARRAGEVLYAVPGSPLVAERSVDLLRVDGRVEAEIVPALSFLDLAWARLGVDPLAAGVRLVDGQRFAVEAAGCAGPLLVGQCDSRRVLSDVKLAVDGGPQVTVLSRLGLPDEWVQTVAWEDLDRAFEPDHLTSLWIPALAEPVAGELVRFAELVRTLRERCPWDREQTHHSLTRHLLEETYEVLEAIDELGSGRQRGAGVEHLEEELGDLLFQVAFHATLAAEEGWFTLADVARHVHDKLVARHPHVFGTVEAETAGAVMANWEDIKRAEKGRTKVMDGVPANLPALLYAEKVQRRAASAGFDWPQVAGAWAKLVEEVEELRADLDAGALAGASAGEAAGALAGASAGEAAGAEVGDVLFSAVNVARHLGVDAEAALREATARFRRRFDAVEALAGERGTGLAGMDLESLDALWEEVKAREG